jgi:predicted amidohydrolase YtcJ
MGAGTSGRAGVTLLAGGRVLTLDARSSVHEALAVAGDRVVAVGSRAEVTRAAPRPARVIELRGATVVPGLIDAHAHMEREGLKRLRLSLAGARSVGEVLDRIGGEARRRPKGDWIVTLPIGEPPFYFGGPAALAEGRLPTRGELDRVAPDHPVYVMGAFGTWGRPPTYAALNTRALALNGVSGATTPACSGVTIERDPSGEPTGVIVEANERPTIEFDLLPAVPRFSGSDRLAALRDSMRLYNAAGTTSVYEGHGSAPATLALYRTLWERGELSVRVSLVVSPTWADAGEAARVMRDWLGWARGRGLGDSWLRVSGIHVGLGGDRQIAALSRRVLPDTGWSGFVESANSLDEYRAYVRLAAEHDLRVHTVILDRLAEVLPVLEEVDATHPLAGRRWVMVHLGRLRPADVPRLRRLGLLVTTIPVYQLWKNGDEYLGEPDGGEHVVPHATLLEAGIPVAAGSDNIPYDLLHAMWAARARQERGTGRVLGPGQRLDGEQSLRLVTSHAASLSFEERVKGTLEPGKLADLAVLSEDPTRVAVDSLRDVQVLLTMVGGRIVHDRLGRAG